MTEILVVEDELIVAEDIQRSLKDSGYGVSAVTSGEEALQKTDKVDLVLMDIVLEGTMNGIEAAQYLHDQFDIPVVFLTAYADEKTLKKAKMAKPYGYLVKPFEDRELHATIEMALYRHEMEKKVEENKKWLEEKIEERSRRIEVLLDIRQSLQKEGNWEKGLITIAEGMARLGFERCGIFLVNPVKNTLEYHFGKGTDLPEGDISLSLLDTEYFGVRCVVEKKTIHIGKYNPKKGRQISSESDSFVWVPIIVQDEAFAALAADNIKSSTPITEEDVKDLEILAGMCGVFIDRTRILVEPIPENSLETEFKHWLDPSEGYIVVGKTPERSFEIFCDLVTHGIPGFVISREYPEKLKKEYKLAKTPILWLSRFERDDAIHPDSISKLVYIIRDFTKKSEESVILLDGLEYLVTQTGFETVLYYLQELKDIMVTRNSRLIVPVHKDVLSLREYSILEREFKVL